MLIRLLRLAWRRRRIDTCPAGDRLLGTTHAESAAYRERVDRLLAQTSPRGNTGTRWAP